MEAIPDNMNVFDNVNVSIDYFIERRCMPSWTIPESVIAFHDLTLLMSGKATYIINGTPVHLKAGDAIYIPKGCSRQAYTYLHEPMHCYAVNFQCTAASGEDCILPFPRIIRTGAQDSQTSLYKYLNRVWLERNCGYMLEARGILMLILKKYVNIVLNDADIKSCKDERIDRVKEYILNHFHDKIELSKLAGISKLHPVYFGTFFRKKTGISLNEYINRIRIQKAEDMLSSGEYTVTETGYRCGFEDIFYFSKVFKKIKGYPPSDAIKFGHL